MGIFDKYEFGYSWFVAYGHLVTFALGAALLGIAIWRRWPRRALGLAAVIVIWAVVGLFFGSRLGLNAPMALPTERFLASDAGTVLDAGAGSGRAAIGVLLARPRATVVGLDLYEGYWGIEENTPERFMRNAQIAGVADRARAVRGDMRAMPFDAGAFDAVISAYAIDHLGGEDLTRALSEVSRVLTPRGELLVLIVNPDWVTWIASPHAVAHHRRPDRARWRAVLRDHGFTVEEEGTTTATLFFYAIKGN